MSTRHTNFGLENQLNRTLFKRLFHFQIELDKYDDNQSHSREETEELIEKIDQLMEVLIETYSLKPE